MCNCHSILECCVMFSGVKLSMRLFNLFQRLRQQAVVILTWGEALHSKEQIIKQRNPEEFGNVFNRLGGFHRATSFMGINRNNDERWWFRRY